MALNLYLDYINNNCYNDTRPCNNLTYFLKYRLLYSVKNIAESLELLGQKIHMAEQQYGREPGSVKLVAVSKTRPASDILMAASHNQTDFGENYAQEAISKITDIAKPGLIWHFIGPVQSNKTREIAAHFQWVHSVDRAKIARRLSDARPENMLPLNICIQINISNEPGKAGIQPSELGALLDYCSTLPGIRVRGLMALPAPENEFEKQRIPFRALKKLLDDFNKPGTRYDTLSMGTTHDFEAAIAEGATIIRIGTAIFGSRS